MYNAFQDLQGVELLVQKANDNTASNDGLQGG